jgi:hypothetical protein
VSKTTYRLVKKLLVMIMALRGHNDCQDLEVFATGKSKRYKSGIWAKGLQKVGLCATLSPKENPGEYTPATHLTNCPCGGGTQAQLMRGRAPDSTTVRPTSRLLVGEFRRARQGHEHDFLASRKDVSEKG